MPPAYADIFTSGIGIITTPYVVLEVDLDRHNRRIHFPAADETGDMGSPPAYYSNTPSPQETSAPPPKVKTVTKNRL